MSVGGEDRYKLYALPHSLYSGKVRSYLRYKRIPYEEVVSTLRVFYRLIIPRTGVKFIPVVQTPDDVVIQDTTEIIDALERRFPQPSIYPVTPRQKLVALLIELYADEWLLNPAMHYRWSFWHEREHIRDVLENFGLLLSPRAPRALRRIVGKRFCQPFANALPMLGITPRTIPALEASYLQLLDQLDAHFARHPYLLGTRPSIGDFGLIGPLYAHLGRDLYPKALMQARAPRVYAWVERMNAIDPAAGDFLPGDEIPDTLLPVLRGLFGEFMPVALDTVARLDRWLLDNPGRKIPRMIGEHEIRYGDVTEKRLVFPYTQWMLQRPLDHYRSLDGAARTAADALLREVGGHAAMQLQIRQRVARQRNRLIAEADRPITATQTG